TSPVAGALIRIRDHELFGGEEGDHLVPRCRYHDFLFDARRRMAVRRWAVGLEGKDHAFLELDGVVQGVEPADDGALVQRQAETVSKLQAEGLHLAVEAEVLRFGPGFGD